MNKEQKDLSERLFNGNRVRIIVAGDDFIPSNFVQTSMMLEEIDLGYTETVIIFPEIDIKYSERLNYIENLIKGKEDSDFLIITNEISIIINLPNQLVFKIEDKKLVNIKEKTYCGNINDLHMFFNNEGLYPVACYNFINKLRERILIVQNITPEQEKELQADIDMIGEEIIAYQLQKLLDDKVQTLNFTNEKNKI